MATEEKRKSKAKAKAEPKAETKAEVEVDVDVDADVDANVEVDIETEADQSTSATKRKSTVDEIEVDLEAPEPPSKRARRALKKGKPLPAKVDSDDEKAAAKEKKEKVRSEHGVWIGNLPFKLTATELRKWMVDNSGGVITDESITRIKLPTKKEPGRDKSEKPTNKGFAYVDFTDIGGKVAAIALSETDLQARRLLIKDSKSFEGRPAKEKEADDATKEDEEKNDPNASRKIFVGNMGFKTTQDDLTRQFEKCGEVEWAKLATFEDTGKCKGFGWVRFTEPAAAAWAVKGFVKIKEEIETEDDFKKKDEDDSDEEAKPKEKQFKTRKWWVNRMMGRELKIELAEDDQLRYRKRFGKDAPGKLAEREERQQRGAKGRSDGDGDKSRPRVLRPMKESDDIQVARLTGAMVKPTGTKMTFD